ncbi:DNA-binding transcriptional regulator EnvR [Pelotomaculum sp. FP]|uniref:TetR/AcrR family transcriptional regulator n=1 Tax=Pelotomaculum sp. FP TaxID=261474 RepID=UPI00106637BE|nr:TetR/AcrR family transcriptional regulator [Pelotomaculum sp. FP]TEB12009.1 DNA-binding transcriptional regulator EnvR [Pelotomaculum sp. FP]
MVNQADLRVVRSKKMIKDAFVDLIEKEGYENITIKDIAKRAMINRKTFYCHYESKAVLFDEIVKDTLDLLMQNLQYEKLDFDDALFSIDLQREIQTILHNVTENRRLFRILFSSSSSYELTMQIERLLQTKIIYKLIKANPAKYLSEIPRELLTSSVSSVFMIIIKWWINQDVYSEEDAAKIFLKLVSTGFTKSFGFTN